MPSDDRPDKDKLRRSLLDILDSIERLSEFTDSLSYEEFLSDLKTRLAVERLLQIITEAAYRLGNQAATVCPGPNWKGLRGMGNILRHAYHRIDYQVVWSVMTEDLPILKKAAQEALLQLSMPVESKDDSPAT